MKEIVITNKNCGGRLDKMLYKYLDKAPSGFIYKMLRKKNIVLNDKKAKGFEILSEGDTIKLYLSDETISKFKTTQKTFEKVSLNPPAEKVPNASYDFKEMIVYEDENIIVLNKPAGLLSQKAQPEDISLNDLLVSYIGKSDIFTPGLSNRLDRNTSGLVLAGKNLVSTRLLNEAINLRNIKKSYLALAVGNIKKEEYLKGYLIKDKESNKSLVYNTDFCCGHGPNPSQYAQLIKTTYKPIASNGSLTLLEVNLITGKSHQIRAQLAQHSAPLAGDYKYGIKEKNDELKEKYGLESQFLCAFRVEFEGMKDELSYLNGKAIKAPLPDNFINILKGENLWQPGLQEA